MVNEFRFGWVRDFSYAQQQPFALNQLAGELRARHSRPILPWAAACR